MQNEYLVRRGGCMRYRPLHRNVERRQGAEQVGSAQGPNLKWLGKRMPYAMQCQSSTREEGLRRKSASFTSRNGPPWFPNGEDFILSPRSGCQPAKFYVRSEKGGGWVPTDHRTNSDNTHWRMHFQARGTSAAAIWAPIPSEAGFPI